MYDASIGRWSAVDQLSDKNNTVSEYAYVFNNPIIYMDFMGLDSLNSKSKGFNWDDVKPGDFVDGVEVLNEVSVTAAKPESSGVFNNFFGDVFDIFSGNVGSKLYGTGSSDSPTEDLSVRDSQNLKKVTANQLKDGDIMALIEAISGLSVQTVVSKKDYKNIIYTNSQVQSSFYVEAANINAKKLTRVGFGNRKLRYNPNEANKGGGYVTWYAIITLSNGSTTSIPINAAQYIMTGEYTEQDDKLLENAN
jgi:hypothetical protein